MPRAARPEETAGGSFCIFAVQLWDEGARPAIEQRAGGLVRFYEPLRASGLALRWVPGLRLLLGSISAEVTAIGPDAVLTWGGPLPAHLIDPDALIGAGDGDLRALDTVTVAMAAGHDRARIVSGAGGIVSVHAASSERVTAWSTHGVAAAWLAHGAARIDASALPELSAFEFVGGDRTLLAGVRAVPVATRIDLSPAGTVEESFWPRRERWAPIPEREAGSHAEWQLLRSLERRLRGAGAPLLGLTGGLDSLVVAAALHELGVDFHPLTWGPPDSSDVQAAREVAAALGREHRWRPIDPPDGAGNLARLDRLARWSDGICPLDLRGDVWPTRGSAFVNGIGGEVGRGFYYTSRALDEPDPSARRLRRFLAVPLRVFEARADAIERVTHRVDEWLADAESLGYNGWRRLDVMYGEQRLRRWGRLSVPRSQPPTVPAFATPEVTRALASLPLEHRVTDAFHRSFVERRLPALAPDAVAARRSPVPLRWARRLVAPLPFASRPLRRTPPERGRWPDAHLMAAVPEVRAWLADEVLGSKVVADGMGEGWVRYVRERFLAYEWRATSKTLLIASPVALEAALNALAANPPERVTAGR